MASDVEGLTRRLAAADPLPDGLGDMATSAATLEEMRLLARSGAREPKRRGRLMRVLRPRTRRGGVILAAVGLVVVGGAAAATTIISTYSGQYVSGSLAGSVGSGEGLRIGGAGYCTAVAKLTADVPYPAGYGTAWRDWELLFSAAKSSITIHQLCSSTTPEVISNDGLTGAAMTTDGGVDSDVARSAFCAWADDWLRAKAANNATAASKAAFEIAGALGWPASRTADPNPSDRVIVPADQGGGVRTSLLGWFVPIQQAVRSGDVSKVRDLFVFNRHFAGHCAMYRPPAGSDNGTVLTPATLAPPAQNGA